MIALQYFWNCFLDFSLSRHSSSGSHRLLLTSCLVHPLLSNALVFRFGSLFSLFSSRAYLVLSFTTRSSRTLQVSPCIYLYRIAEHDPPVFLVLTHHCLLTRSAGPFRYVLRMYLYPVLVALDLYPTTVFTSVSFYRVATLVVMHYTSVGSGCITPSSHFTPNESSMLVIST